MIETFYRWLAWKLPAGLVKWCSVRLMAAATVGDYSGQIVSELTALEALQRWER